MEVLNGTMICDSNNPITQSQYVCGRYVNTENDNLEVYLKEVGMCEDTAKKLMKAGYTVDAKIDGPKLVVRTGVHVNFFIIFDEEYDDLMYKGCKSFATYDREVITVTTKLSDGTVTKRIHTFTKEGFVLTFIANNVVSERRYKRIA